MKNVFIPALLALSLAACATRDPLTQENRQDLAKISTKVADVENKWTTSYSILERQCKNMGERLTLMEGRLAILEEENRKLRDEIGKGALATPAKTPVRKVEPGNPDENAAEITQAALKDLKAGTIDNIEVLRRLIPLAETAAPLVMDELLRNQDVPDYPKKLEAILSAFPVDSLRPHLKRALAEGNEGIVTSVAHVIERTRNRELSRLIEPLLLSAGEDYRLILSLALVECRNPAGLRPLVAMLSSEEKTIRDIAIYNLKKINGGIDFNFRSSDSVEQNAGAIQEWDRWVEEVAPHLFEENR